MFNERVKSVRIGSYHVYDNTTHYRDYWAEAVSPPPENAPNVKECGCYIVKEKDESERVRVTYTIYYTCHLKEKNESERVWVTYTIYYTYHYLCKNLTSEYRSKKKY